MRSTYLYTSRQHGWNQQYRHIWQKIIRSADPFRYQIDLWREKKIFYHKQVNPLTLLLLHRTLMVYFTKIMEWYVGFSSQFWTSGKSLINQAWISSCCAHVTARQCSLHQSKFTKRNVLSCWMITISQLDKLKILTDIHMKEVVFSTVPILDITTFHNNRNKNYQKRLKWECSRGWSQPPDIYRKQINISTMRPLHV